MHLACVNGSVEMLRSMFTLQPNRKSSSLSSRDVVQHTPLHKAVLFDRADAAEFILDEVRLPLQGQTLTSCCTFLPSFGALVQGQRV